MKNQDKGRPRAISEDEAARRMEIVARYAAVTLPTAEDDVRFAAELGLSVDSLFRLTRALRLRRERARDGKNGDEGEVITSPLPSADPDLSRVSPSRRPLVKRRLAAIRDYLSVDEPSREDLIIGAAAVDLPVPSFARMVRCWEATRDPTALPGAREPLRKAHRKEPGPRRAVLTHIAAALSELGTDVSSLALHRKVAQLCEADGVPAPAKSTMYLHLMRARAEKDFEVDARRGFALDHCALSLAVVGPSGPQMPIISFLFDRSTGRIVTHRMSLEAPTALRAADVIRDGARLLPVGAPQVNLKLGIPMEQDWDRLLSELRRHGVVARPSPFGKLGAGTLASRDFGDVIGNIRLRPRHTADPRGATLSQVMGRGSPLGLDEAQAAVVDAVGLHNRGRREPIDTFAAEAARDPLLSALDGFGR